MWIRDTRPSRSEKPDLRDDSTRLSLLFLMIRGFLKSNPCNGASRRGSLLVANVATPSKPPSSRLAKRSKVEIIKEKSDFLRHPLMEELVNDKAFIGEESMQLMKFHGSYQQDHREKRAFGAGKVNLALLAAPKLAL